MRRKLFMLIAALLLVLTTSVAPMKVAAQGLVEYKSLVVGIATDEAVELYLPSTDHSRLPAPLPPTLDPELVVSIQAGGGPVCSSQTVQFTVPPTPALINILNVYRGEVYLMINGEMVGEALSDCNRDANRVLLTLRVGKDGQGQVNTANGLGNLIVGYNEAGVGHAIVDLTTGETVDTHFTPDGKMLVISIKDGPTS